MKLETVVIGTDFSPCAEAGFAAARRLLPSLGCQRLHVVHVVESASWVSPPLVAYAELLDMARDAAHQRLERFAANVPEMQITREVRVGSPAREVALAAEAVGAQLIVVATHGRTGLARAVMGSVASDLVRVAHVPVLVVPSDGRHTHGVRRVLAAVDLSPVSGAVLEEAHRWARAGDDARLRVLSLYEHPIASLGDGDVLPHYPSPDEIEQLGQDVKAKLERLIDAHVGTDVPTDVEVMSKGPAAQVILDVATFTETDLVVVGTSGKAAWHRMIVGSTATRVLAEAGRPVLVVPHDVEEPVFEGDAVPIRRGGPSAVPSGRTA